MSDVRNGGDAKLTLTAFVTIKWDIDTDPDTSHLGEYSSEEKEGSLDRAAYGISVRQGECRYFKPANHWPHNPKNWEHMDGKEKAEIIKEHGSLRNADLHYAVEDLKRTEAFNNNEWWMEFCKVTVRIGTLSASKVLSGTESDSSDEHKKDTEEECRDAALGELENKILRRLEVE